MDYVEQFQLVEAAMVLAKVSISDRQKTLQFVKGIKDMSNRHFILEKAPKTLSYCYAAVLTLRQAKTLAADPSGGGVREFESSSSSKKSRHQEKGGERRELRMLAGEAKDKAWKEGRCIGCGSPHHMIRNCSNSGEKKKFKNFVRKLAKKPAANPPMSKDKKN
eukprot:611414-Rhodomonas_salina.1